MQKFLIMVAITLLSYKNVYAGTKWGKGDLTLSSNTVTQFIKYIKGNFSKSPHLFAVSEDGNSFMYYFCPSGPNNCRGGDEAIITECEKYSNGSPCKVWARKRSIIWKNDQYEKRTSVKKSFLKDPYKVAKLIQDLGFYDGDINELPGIDPKTAQIIEDEEIKPKKKKTKITETVETNSNNISNDTIEKLKSLKELFDTGVLTEEEFIKAKKKLLNL